MPSGENASTWARSSTGSSVGTGSPVSTSYRRILSSPIVPAYESSEVATVLPASSPGRPGGYPPGLPQIRACPINAHGSSCYVRYGTAEPSRTRRFRKSRKWPDFVERVLLSVFVWDTSTGFNAPAMFPSNSHVTRRLLPSTGSLGMVPRVHRYYETLRLPSVPLAALRCLRLAIPPLRPVCSQRPDAGPWAGELLCRFPSRACQWRRTGLSGSRAPLVSLRPVLGPR